MCDCRKHQNIFKKCDCLCPEHKNFELAYKLALARYDTISELEEDRILLHIKLTGLVKETQVKGEALQQIPEMKLVGNAYVGCAQRLERIIK